jgi:D-alanine--D-alanine ligase
MKVVILAGGISTERDVSLSTGRMIYEAVKKNGHQAVMLDVYLGYTGENVETIFDREEDWAREVGMVGEEKPDIGKVKAMREDGGKSFFGPEALRICQMADVVFLALHGENGEDGRIQACFDLMGIRYTGTDYVSSALCMDKGLAKELFDYHGIPTPKGIRLGKGEPDPRSVPFPCIVKSCCGGSSVGVCIAHDEEEYGLALQEGFRYDKEVIIEQYIKGREFSVGVLDGKALPVIEIAPLNGFYNYKNKYQAGSTVETCPAQLPDWKTREMQHLAEQAFRVLRLKNYARMDFMMSEEGEIFCLEANTLPGMTPTSLLPQEAKAAGIRFEELCERILQSAVGAGYKGPSEG